MNIKVAAGSLRQPTPFAASGPMMWSLAIAAAAVGITLVFFSGLKLMVGWWSNEEYSHAWLIPPIAAFLVWQKRYELRWEESRGSWLGVVLCVLGLLFWVIGELSALYTVVQYAFLLTFTGAVMAFIGGKVLRQLWVPMLLLVFMVPLPNFIYFNLSQKLQLLSSGIGVAVIRLFGISVYLEGNVIDLGSYKLQVVEACSGLRYLFPLMTLGFITAVFFRGRLWQRVVLFVSTVPITVLMNSFRIGVIGVLVDRYGIAQAEGFLHDFEGWVIFMACFLLLFVEMWLLARLSGDRRPIRDLLDLQSPAAPAGRVSPPPRAVPAQAWVVVALLAAAAVPALLLPERVEIVPGRADFSEFPLRLEAWSGRRGRIETVYLDELKLSDYIMADYVRDGDAVNFYSAWYDSQRKGQSVHSPKACLPGGGWVIESFTRRELTQLAGGRPQPVNRVLISHGDQKQLVYYWFQQRGRFMTNEYLVKGYLFWDALTRNRSDGSLVRLITPIGPNGSERHADEVLQDFARQIAPLLPRYIPD